MRLLLLCALLLPALASAQIYRWTDAQGRVHFGEQPGGSNAQQVEVKPQVVERDAATREREARTEQFYDARREERAKAQEQAAEAQAKRAGECRELRNNLAQIQRDGRYFVGDDAGNRTYISDEELESARSRLSTRIAERCS
ncbi:DUF4124 domain-containing protein [Pseudomonas sp. L-22-4S-12]|uniref:DUF4124 domain-containing protein n=1 Tax=Pseudomonas sp. L-22-4S-12 TaxID=2610893 RepID=UPI001321D948|nr:DUF4124 domain-containing protein [Pseudomonas sp. L-22-4S-12]MWV17619.1 DUF4124 domain-containing protein [Pseudomonas sp. L-22-4S-12]